MSTEDNSIQRLVDSSTGSAALMSKLAKDLGQLVGSDALAELPQIQQQLSAARDQLDVAAIALHTEIEAVTKPDTDQSEGSDGDSSEQAPAEPPVLEALDGGAEVVEPANQMAQTETDAAEQDVVEQDVVEQDAAEQDVVEQDAAEQDVVEQDAAEQDVEVHDSDERSDNGAVDTLGVSMPPLADPEVRRVISIPNEIADDADAVARFVVEAPQTVLLVEGDSVAGQGWPTFSLREQRAALISYLAELSSTSGCAPDVVLDGRSGTEGTTHASKEVRLRLTKPPTAPVQALDELIDAYPTKWSIAVVTDNQELADSAADRNAAVLSTQQLLNLFIPS